MRRRGFTLVELLIGIVLLALISTPLFLMLTTTQKNTRRQQELAQLQQDLRIAALALPRELREIGFDSNLVTGVVSPDIVSMSATGITFRAVRAAGIICGVGTNAIIVDTTNLWFRSRAPNAATDSVMIFAQADPQTRADDMWVRRGFTGPTATTCPSAPYTGRGALRISGAALLSAAGALDSVRVGSPVRFYEVMEYTVDGGDNLAARSVSAGGALQPVLGPLAADGLQFTYLDSLGAATTTINQVRSVRIWIIERSRQRVTAGGGGNVLAEAIDTLVTTVALRNSFR